MKMEGEFVFNFVNMKELLCDDSKKFISLH